MRASGAPSFARHSLVFRRVHVGTSFALGLVLFHDDGVVRCVSIMAYPGHLPADLHVRQVGLDAELVLTDVLCDDAFRKLTDLPATPSPAIEFVLLSAPTPRFGFASFFNR